MNQPFQYPGAGNGLGGGGVGGGHHHVPAGPGVGGGGGGGGGVGGGEFYNKLGSNLSPEMLNVGLSAGQELFNRQKAKWMPGVSDFWTSLKIYFAVRVGGRGVPCPMTVSDTLTQRLHLLPSRA